MKQKLHDGIHALIQESPENELGPSTLSIQQKDPIGEPGSSSHQTPSLSASSAGLLSLRNCERWMCGAWIGIASKQTRTGPR